MNKFHFDILNCCKVSYVCGLYFHNLHHCWLFLEDQLAYFARPKQLTLLPVRVVSRAYYFQKISGCPKLEVLKLGHVKPFQNHEITGEDSYVQSNWIWKKDKRNNPFYCSVDKSLFIELQTIIFHFFQWLLSRLVKN